MSCDVVIVLCVHNALQVKKAELERERAASGLESLTQKLVQAHVAPDASQEAALRSLLATLQKVLLVGSVPLEYL